MIIPRLTSAELSTKNLATYKRRVDGAPSGHESHEGTLVYVIGDTNTGLVSPTVSTTPSYSRMQEVTKEGLYYFGFDEKWHPVGGGSGDTTNDAWVNNAANTRVELGTLSDGTTARTAGTEVVMTDTGRVGIKTATPNASLEVKKSTTTPTTSVDGIIPPNISKTELANKAASTYAAAQTGAIVYVSDASGGTTGTSLSQVANINATGYYFFDGAALVWKKIDTDTNLYSIDGALAGNRTVTQAGNTLAFTGTAVNAFSVDGTTLSVDAANNRVGLSTATPQKTLHVNGALQVTNELNVGGNSTTAGSAGTTGQLLTSEGANAAPAWKNINSISGSLAATYYVQGTNTATINASATALVPGLSVTITVPTGRTQTVMFTVVGYAKKATSTLGAATQGVFALLQGGTKISSAYASSGDGGDLENLPAPATILKSVVLTAGTYTFTVAYSSWYNSQIVNYVPSDYLGYNGDNESMLSKMQIFVYNN